MVMDVDENESGTQRPKIVADYGREAAFESIEEEDAEDSFLWGHATLGQGNLR